MKAFLSNQPACVLHRDSPGLGLPCLLALLLLLQGCVGTSNRPLQLLSGAGPIYPAAARAAGIEGDVEVRYRVTETGTVADAEVVRAEPPEVFDQAALTAIRQFRYRPQLQAGTPVAVPAVVSTIRFRLDQTLEYELQP